MALEESMKQWCKCCCNLVDEKYFSFQNGTCVNCQNLYALDGLDLERMQKREKEKELPLLSKQF